MAKADDQVKEAIRVFIREAEKKYNIVRAYIYGSSGFPDPIPPFSGS
jgi:hypothetical protein